MGCEQTWHLMQTVKPGPVVGTCCQTAPLACLPTPGSRYECRAPSSVQSVPAPCFYGQSPTGPGEGLGAPDWATYAVVLGRWTVRTQGPRAGQALAEGLQSGVPASPRTQAGFLKEVGVGRHLGLPSSLPTSHLPLGGSLHFEREGGEGHPLWPLSTRAASLATCHRIG